MDAAQTCVEPVIKFSVWTISLTLQGISVPMIWLMIQNLFESVWEISKPQALIGSGMSVFSWFPLDMGCCQTSLNMVAKLVNAISVDAMIPVGDQFPDQHAHCGTLQLRKDGAFFHRIRFIKTLMATLTASEQQATLLRAPGFLSSAVK